MKEPPNLPGTRPGSDLATDTSGSDLPALGPPAELLILKGRVFRGGDPRRIVRPGGGEREGLPVNGGPDALAVRGGRIAWVGRARDARAWRGPATEIIDAGGGLIGPGFEDAHLHFRMGAVSLLQVDLHEARTIDELAGLLQAWVRSHPEASWIVGRGWHYGLFPGGMPDRSLLDGLVPDRPAVLESNDGHTHWLNSAALERARITPATPDPPHGSIERDGGSGEPTGILKEFAHELLDGVAPLPGQDEVVAALRSSVVLSQRHGLTAVQEAWAELDDLRSYGRLRDEGALGLRLRVALPADPADWRGGLAAGRRLWRDRLETYAVALAAARPDEWLRGGIVKAFADGVVESGTAWLLAPYEGVGEGEEHARGRPNWTPEALSEMTAVAVEAGWQVEIHAIGDAAIRAALDAHEAAGGRRGRVEHVEWPDPVDILRFGLLGVVASMQPTHALPVPHKLAVREQAIGTRTARGWPWASILRAGGAVAFGSDWPIATLDPLEQVRAAVTRSDPAAGPPGGWLAHERISLPEALACATWGSAFAARAEGLRGTLEVGKAADIAVLDRDLLAEGPGAIGGTSVRATIIGGRVVYRAG